MIEKRTTAHPQENASVAYLQNVTKRFKDVVALDDVSIEARPGEVLAVLGPNGAGKTTAMNIMLGLAKPTSGTARLFGQRPQMASARMRVGTMLQISGVPETLTVTEHVRSFAVYYPNPLPIEQTIEIAGLGKVANRQFGKLSGGQKQRLFFALAMVGNPDLLFLDEPTTGLDLAARQDFWQHVRRFLSPENGEQRTVVLTTHNLEEADALADRIVVIQHGRVLIEGTPAEIKHQVSSSRIHIVTSLDRETVHSLPGVASVERDGAALTILASSAEAVVKQLFTLDPELRNLEVGSASLAEAFLALTHQPEVEGSK